jgi:hypothetical protein
MVHVIFTDNPIQTSYITGTTTMSLCVALELLQHALRCWSQESKFPHLDCVTAAIPSHRPKLSHQSIMRIKQLIRRFWPKTSTPTHHIHFYLSAISSKRLSSNMFRNVFFHTSSNMFLAVQVQLLLISQVFFEFLKIRFFFPTAPVNSAKLIYLV